MNIQERILSSIKLQTGSVILRADFAGMGTSYQVSTVLKRLQEQGVIVRIGTGVYAKTRASAVTGAIIPAGSLESLAVETLKRLGVVFQAGSATTAYNTGRTTQLPGTFVVNTGRRRISRIIEVGGRQVVWENDFNRPEETKTE